MLQTTNILDNPSMPNVPIINNSGNNSNAMPSTIVTDSTTEQVTVMFLVEMSSNDGAPGVPISDFKLEITSKDKTYYKEVKCLHITSS